MLAHYIRVPAANPAWDTSEHAEDLGRRQRAAARYEDLPYKRNPYAIDPDPRMARAWERGWQAEHVRRDGACDE